MLKSILGRGLTSCARSKYARASSKRASEYAARPAWKSPRASVSRLSGPASAASVCATTAVGVEERSIGNNQYTADDA